MLYCGIRTPSLFLTLSVSYWDPPPKNYDVIVTVSTATIAVDTVTMTSPPKKCDNYDVIVTISTATIGYTTTVK